MRKNPFARNRRKKKGKWGMLKKTMEKSEIMTKEDDLKIGKMFEMFEQDKTKYVLKRVVPPGKVRYVFSNQKKILLARDHAEIEFHNKPIDIVRPYLLPYNFISF